MKKLFSFFILIIIFINAIIPSYVFASTAPQEPPEMPDWWKEKYGNKQIEHEDFRNKEIKTIKPPKKVSNPTPIGVAVGLTLEYLVSQNEDLQALHDDFWDQVDKVDKEAARYLQENFGLSGWDDVFYNAKSGVVYVTEQFMNAFNEYFSHEYTDIDYDNILRLLDPNLKQYYDNEFEDYTIGAISYEYYSTTQIPMMVIYVIRPSNIGGYNISRNWFTPNDYLIPRLTGSHYWGHEDTLEEAKLYTREWARNSKETTRSEFVEYIKSRGETEKAPRTYQVNNLGYLPNPYGSKLNNPNEIEELAEYETGIIEIDNEKYHIINVPNPNHTPELEPTHPNYVPTHYPIIRPVIPIPNSPDVDNPNHPANPNNPYSPNNPNPVEVPEIPLIPDITPSPQPSPEPTPDPSPEPSPEPSPPPIPRAPENEFGEGKTCGELDLDLKSIDLFTTKFPFSIPWDVFRAIEAAFGKMGSEEPKFVLSFISDDTILELPDFIKDWVPLVRSIILILFDVSVIYALYRWFGGAS